MCEWMSIPVIKKHGRIVTKVIFIGGIGEKDYKKE